MISRSKNVPVVNTPYRNISTPIPHPEDIWILDAIAEYESKLSTKELPNHECLWVVPEGGSKKFEYGQVIEISKA